MRGVYINKLNVFYRALTLSAGISCTYTLSFFFCLCLRNKPNSGDNDMHAHTRVTMKHAPLHFLQNARVYTRIYAGFTDNKSQVMTVCARLFVNLLYTTLNPAAFATASRIRGVKNLNFFFHLSKCFRLKKKNIINCCYAQHYPFRLQDT